MAPDPIKLNRVKNKEFIVIGGTTEKPKRNYRWTSIENQFAERSNRLTAEVDKARAERSDYEPLFSSFNPNGTFVPPSSAYDELIRQKEKLQNKSSVSASLLTKTKGMRATTALPGESSLMASGGSGANLFTRVGTVDGSPSKVRHHKTFKNSAEKGIRSAAFKQL